MVVEVMTGTGGGSGWLKNDWKVAGKFSRKYAAQEGGTDAANRGREFGLLFGSLLG